MKVNNFKGDLTDISVKKTSLVTADSKHNYRPSGVKRSIATSVCVFTVTLVRSPQKLFIFMIKHGIYRITVS